MANYTIVISYTIARNKMAAATILLNHKRQLTLMKFETQIQTETSNTKSSKQEVLGGNEMRFAAIFKNPRHNSVMRQPILINLAKITYRLHDRLAMNYS